MLTNGLVSMVLLCLLFLSSSASGCKTGKVEGKNTVTDSVPAVVKADTATVLPVSGKFDTLAPGTYVINYEHTFFTIVIVNLDSANVQVHYKNAENLRYGTISRLLKALEKDGKEVMMITNGGMYLGDGSPQGLFIEKGAQLVALDTIDPNDNNFYLIPNGVFYLDSLGAHVAKTEDYKRHVKDSVYLATQSGPMLVYNDSLHYRFRSGSDNKHYRNAVGVRKDGMVVFAISNSTVNFYDMACLYQHGLGCANALYLDGFVSRMYAPPYKKDMDGSFGPIISVTKK